MASLIGAHFSRNGIKQFPARVNLSMYGNGIGGDETHPETIIILRDTRIFPSGEAPPDFHTFDPDVTGISWEEYGRYWYSERTEITPPPDSDIGFPNFKTCWDMLPPANYYAVFNEQGGGEYETPAEKEEIRHNLSQLVNMDRAIIYEGNKYGRKGCILNLAGGSPGDFELWKEFCAPYIMEAWEKGGNIYGRHCYADKFVNDDGSIVPGQPQRVIDELEYLRSIGYGGGMVLTECGMYGGYGVADYAYFEQQVQRWEAVLRPYSDIFIGFCWWECGDSDFNADYTDHLKKLVPYMQNSYLGRWEPPTLPEQPTGPPDGGNGGTMKITVDEQHFSSIRGFGGRKTKKLRMRAIHNNGTTNVNTGWKELDISEFASLDIRGFEFHATLEREIEVDYPENPKPPSVITLPKGALGVDVSAWQGAFAWDTAVSNGVKFAIVRSSNGLGTSTTDANGRDVQLKRNAAELTRLGIPWAIYHFLQPGQSISEQAALVNGILAELDILGTFPIPAMIGGRMLPSVFVDVEDGMITTGQVKQFMDALTMTAGIYTAKWIWDGIAAGENVWWSDVFLWCAAYGANDGKLPPWTSPGLPRGWYGIDIWQYTSLGGHEVGMTSDNLDLNSAGPYAPNITQPPTPPPPAGKVYSTAFMRGEPGIWRVIRRADGSGENVWELPLDSANDVRVKNENEGEWYEYRADGVYRLRDTSPAPQTDGTARLYLLSINGTPGGKIAPAQAEIGKLYSYTNEVQFKAKNGCANLAENSGLAPSTFKLVAVVDNYTFNGTGFTVDKLYITEQTGETQLYAEHAGRVIGWVGGGANQANNVWGGELAELYFNRQIPGNEPKRYC